jgi:acyl carrier protein
MFQTDRLEHRVRRILSSVLGGELPSSTDMVTMNNFANWDSLAQVQIIVALEKEFGVDASPEMITSYDLNGLMKSLASQLPTKS